VKLFLLFSALLTLFLPAAAQDVVLPGEVARSAAANYPAVMEARAQRRAALGEQLAARGAFDTVVSSSVSSRLEGFYSGDTAKVEARRALGPLGTEIYGGYRISDGTFPIYEDYDFTNEAGELRVGVIFNLLRNRAIDARRAGIERAGLAVSEAELDLLLTRIEVQQEALLTYWRWVAAGRTLGVFEELLEIADKRDSALRREVRSGARAAIDITENLQNLTRRRELTRRAERDLQTAANALSLYLRNEDGEPVTPSRQQLPGDIALPATIGLTLSDLGARPDVRLFDIAREQLELERRLARNDLQPELRLGIEASDDYGDIGPGGISRDEAELKAGVTLSVPLGRRDARGRLRATEARIEALEQRQRLALDQIGRELRDLQVALEAAQDIVELTKLEQQQAQELLEAELTQFRGGASDFFLVNLREQTAANAAIRLIEAQQQLASAAITYQAATLNLERLAAGGN
jgi:outer membrane protein TolC